MAQGQTAPGRLRRWWLLLLDGDRPWGAIDIRPQRYGVTRYRLVVYPPGISDAERHSIRLWRGWPLWGAVLWVACEIWLSPQIGPWPALAVSTAVSLAAGGVAMALAGNARTRVRVLAAIAMRGYDDATTVAACRKLQCLAAALIEADERLGRGQISAADHEMTWWHVYDEMESAKPAAPGMHWSGRGA